jgi:hypothetical protein
MPFIISQVFQFHFYPPKITLDKVVQIMYLMLDRKSSIKRVARDMSISLDKFLEGVRREDQQGGDRGDQEGA